MGIGEGHVWVHCTRRGRGALKFSKEKVVKNESLCSGCKQLKMQLALKKSKTSNCLCFCSTWEMS